MENLALTHVTPLPVTRACVGTHALIQACTHRSRNRPYLLYSPKGNCILCTKSCSPVWRHHPTGRLGLIVTQKEKYKGLWKAFENSESGLHRSMYPDSEINVLGVGGVQASTEGKNVRVSGPSAIMPFPHRFFRGWMALWFPEGGAVTPFQPRRSSSEIPNQLLGPCWV